MIEDCINLCNPNSFDMLLTLPLCKPHLHQISTKRGTFWDLTRGKCKNRFKEGSPALLIIICQLGKRKLEINDSLAYLQEPKNGDENEDEDEDENRIN